VIAALLRRAVLIGVAVLCVLAMLPAQQSPPSPELVPAADTSAFRPNNIITDAVFYDSGSMSAAQIQTFLNQQGANCTPASGGPACLKNYRMTSETQPADAYCKGRYAGAANETAAAIIAKVSMACGINPRVILVMLQKETGLVTRTTPTAHLYNRAMGFGCPDNAGGQCSAVYPGFFRQVYFAARQFQRYDAGVSGGYKAGISNNIQFNPDAGCGASPVVIANQATANLYNYTPYQPNPAALAAGYGTGDSCSAYGNRNFWLYFTDWFGSTQTVGRDVDAPRGSLDQVSAGVSTIAVRGWTYDPNTPTASINVHVYVDGRYTMPIGANQPRPDVPQVYPGVGPSTGYNGSLAATPGKHTVCVYAVNVGDGYTNPLLGCRTVTVQSFPAHVPVGSVDTVSTSVLSVTVTGWAIDPDIPTAPLRVHVYVDGRVVQAITADGVRSDVGAAYPRATANHGFTFTRTLAGGPHEICFYAINQGAGTANPRLGCKTVTLGGPPVGVLERVTATASEVQIEGWAIDPDTADPITVNVYVDGQAVTTQTANLDRPELETAKPGYGRLHGFDLTIPVPGGNRLVCVYANDVGYGSGAPRLGCWRGTVPLSPPIGNVDEVTRSGGTVTARGWALDLDARTEPVRVHVKVDGVLTAIVWANVPNSRPDIDAVYPGSGPSHGWTATLPGVTSGSHQVCAIGTALPYDGSNALLNCITVVVP
jgi:hypothetical protein